MKEHDFYNIYNSCLKQLSVKLDSYLQGLWKELDYTRGKNRTRIQKFDNELQVFFGDYNTRNPYQFSLVYEVSNTNELKITDIVHFTSGRAYSDKVIELKGIVLKGKTEEDLLESELKQLQKIKGQQEDNLRALEEHVCNKRIELKSTNQQILDIQSRIGTIKCNMN